MTCNCAECGNQIADDRVVAYIDLFGHTPEKCFDCGSKEKPPLVYMGPEGKTGAGHLNVIDTQCNATRERYRQYHNRGAQRCTAG